MLDPIILVMFALMALLIFFMFRNGKKRQQAMQELQSGLRPGAEVMLQSGIYGTVESVDEAENRVVLRSGTTTLVAHRNAVAQIVSPSEAPEEPTADSALAPDDDPAFGERFPSSEGTAADRTELENGTDSDGEPKTDRGEPGDPQAPKA
ncbi:preprotein translocase subunit YajC [Leucobacter massiliensis]|uniref:Preprotein translocase subunit YajC n=1 Tax=Leucobacter massiliensis TaxID=1686285 RepID=A0A2S9QRN4_9MICO|nr:preprotein translocase subunit YajC [Leucobacter massiliensis]PRI12232.1 preprotein translocase subunit YajC [Leucobacter massiliensis]